MSLGRKVGVLSPPKSILLSMLLCCADGDPLLIRSRVSCARVASDETLSDEANGPDTSSVDVV